MRVLSLGWGVQSTTLAFMAELGEIPPIDFAVHAITYESKATRDYIARWAPRLERIRLVPVEASERDKMPVAVTASQYVRVPAFTVNGGQTTRQCTDDWKLRLIKRTIRAELQVAGIPARPGAVEALIGISWDESLRMHDSDVKYIINIYPLVEARITRQECKQWLERNGIEIPPKSGCVFCPYQSKAGWERTMNDPEDRAVAIWADELIRNARPKGGPLFIHPARIPLAQAVKVPRDFGMEQIGLCEGIAGCGL